MIQKNTIQRELVLAAVNELKNHATADEIYQLIVQNHPHISKATVYRNLHQLAEAGDIKVLDLPGGAERYDHLTHPHYHIKCTRCGRFFDIEMDYMDGLAGNIRNAGGFDVTGHDIVFQGVCPQCKTAP